MVMYQDQIQDEVTIYRLKIVHFELCKISNIGETGVLHEYLLTLRQHLAKF
jgi:hypothetical protein